MVAPSMRFSPSKAAAVVLVSLSFGILYWPVIRKLVHDWSTDDNYSHGFFIVPLAAFFVWERRHRLAGLAVRSSVWGLLIVAGGVAILAAGLLGAELFLSRISMLPVIAGIIVFVLGWRHLSALAFPLLFLLLMIPLPAIVFNQLAFPLQLLASQAGEVALRVLNIPILREGNVMILANTTLEVAEACSGIRSLISLLTLGIVYGYFIDSRMSVRVALAVATVPIAILTNAIRVAGTGAAAHYYGPAAAEGFTHTFAGWAVFIAAFALLTATGRLLQTVLPRRSAESDLKVASAAAI